MLKKSLLFVLTWLTIVSMLVACAPTTATVEPTAAMKVVVIGNQRFGDLGPMDAFAAGLDVCESEYGVEIKKLESTDPGRFEEDIRAMAKENYNLIITTFPAMTDATVTVAKEFPAINFYAVYQFANAGDVKYANVWSTEFRGYETNYVAGAFAGKVSTTKKLGYIYGAEEPSINSDANGFVQGVKGTCPECKVEVAGANSWEDPAIGKEIASAMISHGVDYIQTEAAKTQLGAIEAAKAAGILFSGDNGDNYDLYKEGFVSHLDSSFKNAVITGCKALKEGNLPMGQHTFQNLGNNGVYFAWDAVDRFISANPAKADLITAAAMFAKDIQDKIIKGEIVPVYNEASPVGIQ
jgi:basic membrane protein A